MQVQVMSDDEDNESVNIQDNPVNIKLFQSIYNEITGKTETLSRVFRGYHQISMNDIDQLNIKIEQTLGQYKIISSNSSITIYHVDDNRERDLAQELEAYHIIKAA